MSDRSRNYNSGRYSDEYARAGRGEYAHAGHEPNNARGEQDARAGYGGQVRASHGGHAGCDDRTARGAYRAHSGYDMHAYGASGTRRERSALGANDRNDVRARYEISAGYGDSRSHDSRQGSYRAYAEHGREAARSSAPRSDAPCNNSSRGGVVRGDAPCNNSLHDNAACNGATRDNAAHGRAAAHNAKPPRKKSVAKRIVIALLALLALGVAGAAVYINVISGNLHRGVTQDVRDALVKTEYSKEPFYMLLMGTDESAERSADESYGGSFRSDSMMLVRIDCPNKKVTLVSLERDTLVDMGENGYQKLNAASAIGGPAYAIEMVSKMAHNTPISHYALIDFDGFCEVVDALGGIDVDVPIEIDDDDAGGYLAAGQQTLTGEQALILCRSRHAYEEYGSGNAYRSANQRLVLSAIAQKILASDVATIASTVGTLSKYLQTDLGINDIIGLAQALRGLDMSADMYTAMQPTTSLYEGDMWYNVSDEPEWQEMLTRVDQGLPPTETDVVDATGTVLATTGSGEVLGGSQANEYLNKKSGTVVIRNGGAPAGSGGKAGEAIEAMGYTIDVANANSDDFDETLVVYKTADQRADAMEIARAVGKGRAVQNDGGYIVNGDFLVVLGSDYGA